jgi:hypothetical protein
VTPGRYLRLRRQAAAVRLSDLPIGVSAVVIELDMRLPTDAEVAALRSAFRFDTALLAAIARGETPRICRVCGCSEIDACVGPRGTGCHWVERDLCSSCADRARPMPEGLAA